MGVGLVAMLLPLFMHENCSATKNATDDIACEDRNSSLLGAGLLGGGALMLAGTVVMVVGSAINPHPVEPAVARRLADEYNEQLKRELGGALESRRSEKSASAFSLSLRLDLNPQSKGLALSGTF